ncbi:MAG: rod shape-determining protein [Lentisphaeria bacterium]|nr:rod shape-determining protein [Lentisphaeria bacterium]MBR7127540.1 rod shape-determining protein [Lentisphaeria bacterium]
MQKLIRFFSTDIGIDLGTANSLVYVRDNGVVVNEPSVVAINDKSEVLAVGEDAKKMLGKTPINIKAIRPMKDGVIADFDITEVMLRTFIQKAQTCVPWYQRLLRPSIIIAVPSEITEVERRAVKESAKKAGAGDVMIVEEPMAAAVGVGLPVYEPRGNMIVDIGGGTTEVAVISLSGIVATKGVKVGGDELDRAIVQHMKRNHNLMIGELTAEQIKIKIGSAYPLEDDKVLEVRGMDMNSRIPKTVKVTGEEIRRALMEPITVVVEAVRIALDKCPPDIAADLIDSGIMLAGGGAVLKGLDRLISEETGLPVFVSEDPLNAVVTGTGIMLQNDLIYRN